MIYFDNAATSFPKPRRVAMAVQSAFDTYGANPGRSGHKLSMRTAEKVYEARELAAEMFGARVEDVVFTANCSHALNLAIKGILRQKDHVIISDLEHNSVFRPVHALAERGLITYSVAKVHKNPADTVAEFESHINERTSLIACTHGSNVFGIRLPVAGIGAMAREHGVTLLVDCAQTAGVVDINMERDNIDILCTAGHKSLYGPSGTGLMITALGEHMQTLMEGGTGSASADLMMPFIMPDRHECGTVNTAGILGLYAGMSFVREKGIENLFKKEMKLCGEIYRRLGLMNGVVLYTDDFTMERHLPVISFNIDGIPSEDVVAQLSDRGIAVRGGLHCSPLAHRKMNTIDTGTVRVSVGAMNNMEQVLGLCSAVKSISKLRPAK